MAYSALASAVRLRFAARLKQLRTARGFHSARMFAQALGVEENRYTRYERAEVEPGFALLYKMCQLLGTTPSDLFGFSEDALTGLAEATQTKAAATPADSQGRHDDVAWCLASEVTRRQRRITAETIDDPLTVLQATAALFLKLRADPHGTFALIANDPDLAGDEESDLARVRALLRAFGESLSHAASRYVQEYPGD